jgi:hypothetical protein
MRVQDNYNKVSLYLFRDMSVANLTSTYVQLTAGLTEDIDAIMVTNTSGNGTVTAVQFATGAAASEVAFALTHSHDTTIVPIKIGANTRIAFNCPNGTISTGSLGITLLKKI